MINVGELITDPDFCQTFTVYRNIGFWSSEGIFETSETSFRTTGVITPLKTKELDQLPEGDRIQGGVNIYTNVALFTTHLKAAATTDGYVSDEVVWQNERWKIVNTANFVDYGYYKSVSTRKLGA